MSASAGGTAEPLNVPAGADWREPFPKDPQAPIAPNEFVLDEGKVVAFCGFVTAQLPELHGVHPQRVLNSWHAFKRAIAAGFSGVFIDPQGEG